VNTLMRVCLFLVALSVSAGAQEIGTGLICDTKEQIESYITSFEENHDAVASLEAVNNGQTPPACGVVTIGFFRIDTGTPHGESDIVQILIIAVHNGQGFVRVPPMTQFTVFKSDRRGV
jgi:hypothetical protein